MANTKKVRVITVDADKCNGCRTCEIMCSSYHAVPRYSSINPARSRIQVITDRLNNQWLPVFAGEYTASECTGRNRYLIDGKLYGECDFCRATCPSRGLFKEPDSGLPLKCDMCLEEEKPICVKWCLNDVLQFEEREVETDEEPATSEMETGLKSMIDEHGLQKVIDTFARMSKKAAG